MKQTNKKIFHILSNFFLILVSLIFGLMLSEITFRYFQGYSLTHFALTPLRDNTEKTLIYQAMEKSSLSPNFSAIQTEIKSIPIANHVDLKWFYQSPKMVTNPEKYLDSRYKWLTERYNYSEQHDFVGNIENSWNLNFVLSTMCNKSSEETEAPFITPLRRHDYENIYVFKSLDKSIYPRFKLLKSAAFPNFRMVTNRFGFRDDNIPFKKPKRTIRIAFIGASTTINNPYFLYSYPKLVGYWLNLWAQSQHLNIQFDIINGGRSGYNPSDSSANYIQDIADLRPDIVIYYEGINNISLYLKYPEKYHTGNFTKFFNINKFKNTNLEMIPPKLTQFSALAQSIYMTYEKLNNFSGLEPKKPSYKIIWPSSINEKDPDIFSQELPLGLPDIIKNLDIIRNESNKIHAIFILSSFVVLAHEGMKLNMPRDFYIYQNLNQTYWPYSYSWLNRMVRLENRVYENYATHYGLYFIDINKYYSQNPELFTDAVHGTTAGVRLRAWIVLQQLIPLLQKKINEGSLPRNSNYAINEKEYFQLHKDRLITLKEINSLCKTNLKE